VVGDGEQTGSNYVTNERNTVTNSIHIPATVEEAVSELNGIHELLTAKGWAKAAIVAAFCESKQGGFSGNPEKLSFGKFAALGINGLRDQETVSYYVRAWEGTGLPKPIPGEMCEMPTDPWPPASEVNGRDYDGERASSVAGSPESVAAAVAAAEERHGAGAVADAIADVTPTVADAVEGRVIRDRISEPRDRDGLDDLRDRGRDRSRSRNAGTNDPDAQAVHAVAERLMTAMVEFDASGRDGSADLVSQLNRLIHLASAWRESIDGSAPVQWSSDDRAFAAELGIELGVSA